MLVGFVDLHLKGVVRAHELLDRRWWQFDEHSSNLWSSLWTHNLHNEVEDSLSNLFLQVRVLFGNGWQKSLSGNHILLRKGQIIHVLCHSWGSWHTWHIVSLRHWCLWHSLLLWVLLLHHLVLHLLLLHHHLVLLHWHAASLHVLLVLLMIRLLTVLSVWSSLLFHLSLTLVNLVVGLLVVLDDRQKLLQHLS